MTDRKQAVPRLTGLRRSRPGRLALELDGRPWRVVPDEVVVRCRLAPGLELDRPLLREIRRELRRAEAVSTATRALAQRDLSRRRLARRLEERGVEKVTAEGVLGTLEELGLLDDARLACSRAEGLAARLGDAAVEARLESEALPPEHVRRALARLRPERERAAALAASAPDRRAAWKLLSRRGFAAETIEDVIGALDEDA